MTLGYKVIRSGTNPSRLAERRSRSLKVVDEVKVTQSGMNGSTSYMVGQL